METPETAPAPAAARFQELPLNEFFKKILQDGKALSSSFYGEAYKLAKKEGLDTPEFYLKMGDRAAREEINARVAMASIEKERARERYEAGRAARINLENDIRRGLFVAKEKVALVMGRVYAVHTSQLQALGARLAAEVAADLGVETAAGVLKARKRIEEEVYAVLKAIQGLLADYVEGAL
jgi:hypothetical protein